MVLADALFSARQLWDAGGDAVTWGASGAVFD